MFSIRSANEIQDIINKSRFIGVIVPCKTESDALYRLQQLHARHPNATHIPYAYRIRATLRLFHGFLTMGNQTARQGSLYFSPFKVIFHSFRSLAVETCGCFGSRLRFGSGFFGPLGCFLNFARFTFLASCTGYGEMFPHSS